MEVNLFIHVFVTQNAVDYDIYLIEFIPVHFHKICYSNRKSALFNYQELI